jgi:hypothetical protein
MRRSIIAFIGAVLTWVVVASVLNRLLRIGLPGYAAAEPAFAFTLTMLWSRLALGALASLGAGYLLGRVAPSASRLPVWLGGLLLLSFLPAHYHLWARFPVWYHLLFLLTLMPLVVMGARLGRRRPVGR